MPWQPFQGRLLQISLSEVFVKVGPRDEADWEEGRLASCMCMCIRACTLARAPLVQLAFCLFCSYHVALGGSCSVQRCSGPACERLKASERALLSALEVQQASSRSAGGSEVGGRAAAPTKSATRWGLWSLAAQLGRIVLNRLQLSITNVHLCFQVGGNINSLSPAALVDAVLTHGRRSKSR